jgi:hypothetical protein
MPRSGKTETALDLRQLAIIGAKARLAELQTERNTILMMFPELSRRRIQASADDRMLPPAAGRRRKRRISAEGRRRIAEAARRR